MRCANCQFENPEGMNFCGKCATPLTPPRCRQCGFDNPSGFAFCGKCGAALTSGQKVKPNEKERTKAVGAKAKGSTKETGKRRNGETAKRTKAPPQSPIPVPQSPASERRQLTVMFCDLVGSTALSAELDPEEYQAVVQAYQKTCTTIIERYAGRIAQHLGDGILAYFGYPTAHEDDAARAVRASLEMLTAIQQLPTLPGRKPLQIRIGIHTGLVVVGEIGSGEKREILALGETPNLAARIQGVAEPNTVAVSVVTQHLVAGLFDCQELEPQTLKGISTPMTLYRVVGESMTQHRLDVIQPTGLTPLVGREEELALLQRRWEQVKDHEGQMVLLSGEPGIGKSRLVRELRQRVEQDQAIRIEFRCSPYYQNSALQPVIEHLQRLLQWQKDDTPQGKLVKLQTMLGQYHLFVEELTKMVLESGLLTEVDGHYEFNGSLPPLAIPSTLQDSLMARLDRLAMTKELAQLGATLGREFSYDLLHAVSPLDEQALQHGLQQLVETELIYQRGVPPQATYMFKHALIQDTAYQSLLKSRRQQLHQQIAQVLEKQFPDTKATQPELLAHHYTEAGLISQALPYWQQAGQQAVQRSANAEAIKHLTTGFEVLMTLPDTSERARHELSLQLALGAPLIATKGYAAQEVELAYTRARELCRLTGDTVQLFSVLVGLRLFYVMAGFIAQAHEIGEQLLTFAQRAQEPGLLVEAHFQHGNTLIWAGEFAAAREHFERVLSLYDPVRHRKHATLYGQDTRVASLAHLSHALWVLGYPAQAVQRAEQALAHGQECAHPFSLAYAQVCYTIIRMFRGEERDVQQEAEATIVLAREQGFPFWATIGTMELGWALVKQGQRGEGIEPIREGVNAWQAEGPRPLYLAWLAGAYGDAGQFEEGLAVLAEGLACVEKTGGRFYEAELYRLKGQLVLQSAVHSSQSEAPNTQPLTPSPQAEVEECFHRAIAIAQKQQAKSLELRAVMSLARL